jgi:hypothetical protein
LNYGLHLGPAAINAQLDAGDIAAVVTGEKHGGLLYGPEPETRATGIAIPFLVIQQPKLERTLDAKLILSSQVILK